MADEDLVLDEAEQAMDKSLESLRRDVGRIRTGRANPELLEALQVDYYGTPTPLKSLATITAPEARLLVVQPFDPGSAAEIERSILASDLGLTPRSDGKLLRVPVPELTEERRHELVKQVKKMGEDHKVGVRSARRDALAMLKDLEKEGAVSKDDARRAQKKVQDRTDEAVEAIDEMVDAKEEEVLKI